MLSLTSLAFAIVFGAWLVPGAVVAQTIDRHRIHDGIEYFQYRDTRPGKELVAHVLKVSLEEESIAVRSLKAQGKETLRSMVERLEDSGEKVLGAINGDFFHQSTKAGIPYGLQVSDGRLIFAPSQRSMIGFREDNKPYIGIVSMKGHIKLGRGRFQLDGVNVFPREFKKRDGVLLYTPSFMELESTRYIALVVSIEKIEPALQVGDECKGTIAEISLGTESVEVPENGCLVYFLGKYARGLHRQLEKGTEVSIGISLPPIRGGVPQAIGGGPRLVRRGRATVEFDKEDFSRRDAIYLNRQRHPRSAVGYDRTRENLVLVMVEGRHEGSRGFSMEELAEFLAEKLDCHDAMAFDGGGSAALYAHGRGLVSRSVGGGGNVEEREIANSLVITTRPDARKAAPGRDGEGGSNEDPSETARK